ncbi:2-C-methyl-D-erythritol 2,4-cyclodiphosphate synthase [bacterium]|nr:2-C-methyl-D-erythritol 2,4-cyclodiphosphate synthase [bacterium]
MPDKQAIVHVPPCPAIIVAGGIGSRMGSTQPKQLINLLGRPVLAWSVDRLRSHPGVSEVVIVADASVEAAFEANCGRLPGVAWTRPGASRSQSVQSGLDAIRASAPEHVLIHDAARPGLSKSVIDDLLDALRSADAAAPAMIATDALKRDEGLGRLSTVPRDGVVRIQTPQAFRFAVIDGAYQAAADVDAVDDLALIESLGVQVRLTRGAADLMKLTYPEDVDTLTKLLAASPRIGSGFDVHAFTAGTHVRLCGVDIPHSHGLEGHSDADVAWHALTDAVLGALGEGDIGVHFPPSDERWRGADSVVFLAHACDLAKRRGLVVANADITIICEAPRLGEYRDRMRSRTAEALSAAIDAVNVKATTTEQLGFTGRREGVAAQAVVLLDCNRSGA